MDFKMQDNPLYRLRRKLFGRKKPVKKVEK